MVDDRERFDNAVARIDAANADDPGHERVDGQSVAKELIYGRRMSEMLDRLAPDSPEALQLAVRSQHIRRWEIPRASYPQTPFGYKQWRARLLKFHAEAAAAILRDVGYDEAIVGKVQSLLRKEGFKVNPDTQTLEDVADLVFLEHYLADFAAAHPQYDEAKLTGILRKIWRKMSADGRAAALTRIYLPERLAPLIRKAAAEGGGE